MLSTISSLVRSSTTVAEVVTKTKLAVEAFTGTLEVGINVPTALGAVSAALGSWKMSKRTALLKVASFVIIIFDPTLHEMYVHTCCIGVLYGATSHT